MVKPRRKRKAEETVTAPLPEPQAEQAPEGDAEERSANRVSINWYTNEEGKIDTSRMRESMKARIKEMLPELNKEFGEAEAREIVEAVEVIPEEWVSTAYDVLGTVEAIILGKTLKIDKEIADKVFTFTTGEKAKLVPPTARIVNKYAPDWLLRYRDEIALGMLLVTMTLAKIAAAKMMQKMKDAMPQGTTHTSSAPSSSDTKPKPNGHDTTSEAQANAKEDVRQETREPK